MISIIISIVFITVIIIIIYIYKLNVIVSFRVKGFFLEYEQYYLTLFFEFQQGINSLKFH